MLRSSQTFRFRPNHQMASLPSRTDALIPEFFLCLTPYQTLSVKVELPAAPWVGAFYQHFAKTTQGLILHRRHVGAGPICVLEQVMGIEPTSSAWKADIIAIILYRHIWCRWPDSNRHELGSGDFKSPVSAIPPHRQII